MKKVKLGEILTFQRGYDLPSQYRNEGEYPIISSSGISGTHNEYRCDGSNVITGRYGTIGEVYYFNGKCWPLNTALFINNFKGNYPLYIYYLLKTALKIDGKDKSTVPGVNRNVLHQMNVSYHENVDIQKSISSMLLSLDNKIELNNKTNKELEAMAKALYDYWFVQNAEESWEIKQLQDFGLFKNGVNYEKSNVIGEKIKIINVRDISSSSIFIMTENLDEIILPRKEIEKYLINENDIILARSGIPGATRLIEKTENNVIYCGFAICFSLKKNNMREYLYLTLKHNEEITKKRAGGSIMPNITQDSLKYINILNPPPKIITDFNQIIIPIFDQIIKNNQENQTLSQLRDFLLPLLMNGQVQVAEAENIINKTHELKNQDYYNQRFELWLKNQKLAARGNIDRQTLREIFDAMDDDDK